MTPEEKIRDFKKKYADRLKKALNETTKIAAEKTMNDVIARTKEGKGTNGPLKPLSGKYIAFRRRWQSFLANDTSPAKSNLTATGQLLEALYYRVVGPRFFIKVNTKNRDQGLGGETLIESKKTNKKGKTTTTYQSSLTNDQVRDYVENGKVKREFLALSDKEKEDLRKFVAEQLKLALSDILK
jgi:hypothetical protein